MTKYIEYITLGNLRSALAEQALAEQQKVRAVTSLSAEQAVERARKQLHDICEQAKAPACFACECFNPDIWTSPESKREFGKCEHPAVSELAYDRISGNVTARSDVRARDARQSGPCGPAGALFVPRRQAASFLRGMTSKRSAWIVLYSLLAGLAFWLLVAMLRGLT